MKFAELEIAIETADAKARLFQQTLKIFALQQFHFFFEMILPSIVFEADFLDHRIIADEAPEMELNAACATNLLLYQTELHLVHIHKIDNEQTAGL